MRQHATVRRFRFHLVVIMYSFSDAMTSIMEIVLIRNFFHSMRIQTGAFAHRVFCDLLLLKYASVQCYLAIVQTRRNMLIRAVWHRNVLFVSPHDFFTIFNSLAMRHVVVVSRILLDKCLCTNVWDNFTSCMHAWKSAQCFVINVYKYLLLRLF